MVTNSSARHIWRSSDPNADTKTPEGRKEIRTMVRAAAFVDKRSEAWIEKHCRRMGAWQI